MYLKSINVVKKIVKWLKIGYYWLGRLLGLIDKLEKGKDETKD